MTKNPNILVIGSINMDLVVRSHRIPLPGETVLGTYFSTHPGGKGANQAVAAARLGARVKLVGCVGTDAYGETLLGGLRREGVDVESVRTIPHASSGIAVIQVDEHGENAITVVAGANGRLDTAYVEAITALIHQADIVLMQLEIPYASVSRVISIAQEARVPVVLDPAPAPHGRLERVMAQVDFLSPNQHEASALSGIEVSDMNTAQEAASILRDRGARHVVIKMGRLGAFYAGEAGVMQVPPFPVDVVDTTAAGDAFTAAFAVGTLEGMPVREAMRFGCAAGALVVSKSGAQEAMPFREEVERLWNNSQ